MLLQQYLKRLDAARLADVLAGETWASSPISTQVDLTDLRAAIEALPQDVRGAQLDTELVEPVHRVITITRREAADPRTWQWLCVGAFPDVVWRRWARTPPRTPREIRDLLTPGLQGRFLAQASLNGVSRNTFARLWWTAEQLEADYDLARRAFARQDMFQAVFERLFGLWPAAARACLAQFEGRSEDEIRSAAKWLQQSASTLVLEGLSEAQIRDVLAEALEAAA